jgi:UDP-N-acetylglucosamine--N-acetylmuramyl-(pentapeptide) pyrophosphoryl-undecaprenol N-acetylglucosamine transferase
VAVLRELRALHPRAEIRFWSDVKFGHQAKSIVGHFDSSIPVSTIVSGKFRRYYNLSYLTQILRFRTIVFPNIRDFFFVGIGVIQSVIKLLVWRPDVVFTKGGYVCLPVGFAAHLLNIPLVIHDSDAHPGLTNRILSRWASRIATGSPLEYYNYPPKISQYVGIPVAPEFVPYSTHEQNKAKIALGFDMAKPLLLVTGGGLGAERINTAIARTLDDLLKITNVILIAGNAQYDDVVAITPADDERFLLIPFVSSGMVDYIGAADIVITRAGATTLLELAAMAKTTILVPNGHLTGGHQLKNALVYTKKKAVLSVDDDALEQTPTLLLNAVKQILADPKQAKAMATALSGFAKPNAAHDVAQMILSESK